MISNKWKLLLSALLVGFLMLGSLSMQAAAAEDPAEIEPAVTAPRLLAGSCGTNATWDLSDTGVLTISGSGNMTNYTSASGAPWYSLRTSIRDVVVEEGITSIGSYAFCGFTVLTELDLPSTVTAIGQYAYQGCTGFRELVVPETVTSIGEGAFSGCSSLEAITVPFVGGSVKTETDTYQYPFGYIFGTTSYTGGASTTQYYYGSSTTSTTYSYYYIPTSLKSVTVTGGNLLYGAFQNCSNLTSVSVPEDITYIGYFCFYNCTGLTSVTIPDTVTTIRGYAFYQCRGLTSLTIPESVTRINLFAFSGCTGLTSVTVPGSVSIIGESAFRGCSGLTSLELSEGITTIDTFAFGNCTGLTELVIPDSVTTISTAALSGCSGLESITVPFVGGSVKTATSTYQYPFGYIFGTDSYTGGVSTTQSYYGSSTTSTTSSTYYIPISLKSVTVTGGNLLRGAFYNCSYLEEINLPASVTAIPGYAFYNCDGLTDLPVSEGITSLGNYAFANCGGLTSCVIPDGITVLPQDLFFGCNALEYIVIPDGVNSIGMEAFYRCSAIKAITLPDSVATIGTFAFADSTALEHVFYRGTEAEKTSINIESANTYLNDATWHFEVTDLTLGGEAAYHCGKCGYRFYPDGEYVPVTQLEILLNPTKLSYYVNDTVNLEGIFLRGTYEDGETVNLSSLHVESVNVNMSSAGRKTATVTALGATASFELYVHTVDTSVENFFLVEDVPYPESAHNYSNNTNNTQTFTYPNAVALEITFSAETSVESGWDYIYVYNGSGTQVAKYTGTNAAGVTLTIPGDTFKVKLTSDGSNVRYGYSFSSIRANMGGMYHPPVVDPATATCTGPGLSEGSHCEICGIVLVPQEQVDALGHNHEPVETPPTCDEDGYTTYTCSRCGDSYVEPGLAAFGHDWQEADCVTPKTCLNCGETEGEALGHSYESVVTDPTCTEGGYTTHTCTVCGDVYTDSEVPETGHDWQDANCQAPKTCLNCGATEGYIGDHQYEAVVTDPTCTQGGYTTYTCPFCQDSYVQDYVDPTGHNWVDADCVNPRHCTNCDLTEGSALGHDYEVVYLEVTCTEDGGTFHICRNCGDTYGEDVIPAPGHDWTDATCTSPQTCRNCDETQGEPLPHEFGEGVVVPPTCTEDGYTDHICVMCGYSQKDTYVEATGHSWLAATCTEPEICSVCNATQGEALGHDYQNGECTRCHERGSVMEGVTRLSGANRYATGFAVANQLKENFGVDRFQAVVVACGTNFPDALTGSYLASVKNAPLLLTDPKDSTVDQMVSDYLKDNLVPGGHVYILGGTAAVSNTFEVLARNTGFQVVRLKGAGRYETNLAILREAGVNTTDEILIATGKNYADSLSASATGLPMLLVDQTLTDSQKAFLQGTSKKFVILGGTGAVSPEIEAELDTIGDVVRVRGSNRYLTSIAIARKYFGSANAAVLAYAEGFPDGLCGGPLALSIGAPLILTSNTNFSAADEYVQNISIGAVTGGTARISDDTVRNIFDLAANTPIPKP